MTLKTIAQVLNRLVHSSLVPRLNLPCTSLIAHYQSDAFVFITHPSSAFHVHCKIYSPVSSLNRIVSVYDFLLHKMAGSSYGRSIGEDSKSIRIGLDAQDKAALQENDIQTTLPAQIFRLRYLSVACLVINTMIGNESLQRKDSIH